MVQSREGLGRTNHRKAIGWKILCWLSSYCPPLYETFFPYNACDAEQCEWWCHPVGIECDRGDGRTKHTISHGQASPLWWLNICEILHIMSVLSNIDPLTILTSDEHTNKMKYNQDIKLSKEPCILPKKFSFSDQHQEEVLCWPVISYQQALSKRATGQKVSSTMQEELITRKRCQPPRVARSQWSKCHAFFLSTHHRGETMSAVKMSTYSFF